MYKKVQLIKDKEYYWCSCGLSTKLPFCDASHKGTGMKSVKFTAQEDAELKLCVCQKTSNPPYCENCNCVGSDE